MILHIFNNVLKNPDDYVKKILENEIKTDPKDQWKEMFKSGMFNDKSL